MNYYIQGDAAKADQINAAFKKLGYDTSGHLFNANSVLYFTLDGEIRATTCNCTPAIIMTHPDYKELPLHVKSIFKAVEWVVYNCTSVWQVNGIDWNMPIPRYELTNNDGDKLSVPFTSEYNLNQWTIQDAKDGDVLYSLDSKRPFIYKERPQFSQARGYCCINKFGEFAVWNTNKCVICTDKYIPATQEQRELLFAKMKEEGYQWDAEKKELRKIKPHYDIANFKPFDKVLVKYYSDENWKCGLFSHLSTHSGAKFVCVGSTYVQCIPFDGNEHLLGTTDMPDECYINW